jgi:hypothetical protein
MIPGERTKEGEARTVRTGLNVIRKLRDGDFEAGLDGVEDGLVALAGDEGDGQPLGPEPSRTSLKNTSHKRWVGGAHTSSSDLCNNQGGGKRVHRVFLALTLHDGDTSPPLPAYRS